MSRFFKYVCFLFFLLCIPSVSAGTEGGISISEIKLYDENYNILDEIEYSGDVIKISPQVDKVFIKTKYSVDVNTDTVPSEGWYPKESELIPKLNLEYRCNEKGYIWPRSKYSFTASVERYRKYGGTNKYGLGVFYFYDGDSREDSYFLDVRYLRGDKIVFRCSLRDHYRGNCDSTHWSARSFSSFTEIDVKEIEIKRVWCIDNDKDGYFDESNWCSEGNDCNDGDPNIYPGAAEICDDGKDNDCDPSTPDQCCSVTVTPHRYNYTLDVGSGGAISLGGGFSEASGKSVKWSLSVGDRTFTGSGNAANVLWSGLDDSGKFETKTYPVTLRAETTDGECSDSVTFDVTVKKTEDCKLKVTVGSSGNVASGEMTDSLNLFSASGTGPALDFGLHYASQDGYSGPLGIGWHHSYDISLSEQSTGDVVLKTGSGQWRIYTASGSGYASPAGDYSTLVKNADGTFALTRKNGSVYRFTALGKIVSITDRNGNALTFTYAGGLLAAVTDASGRSISFNYDGAGKLASVTDPSGNSYGFTVAGDVLAAVTLLDGGVWSYSYDADAFLTAKTDPLGSTTSYLYDERHRLVESIDPQGQVRTIDYPELDETVRTTTVTEKDGGVWRYTYDTDAGDLLEKTDPQGIVTSYTYDANGNTLSKTDAGGTTAYAYDAQGNMTSVTDEVGQTTSYEYNAFGQVTSVTDPEGATTTYGYDERGNLISVKDAAGAETRYEVDDQGRVTAVINADGQRMSMTYDGAGNVTSVTDFAGSITTMEYDTLGRLVRQTTPDGGVTRYEYDSSGNLVKLIDPLGQATSFTYDARGNKTSQTDANGNTTRYEYNALGQMVRMIDAEGNATDFNYGSAGCASCGGGVDKLTALTDANGNATAFTYDTLGRLVEETDPLGHVTSYAYDARGNLSGKTDAKGQTIAYSYDALSRLTKKVYPDGSTTRFTYDARGNILTAANAHIRYDYEYDESGRVTGVTDSFGRTVSYEYDKLDNKTKMIAPDGKVLRYEYDEAGRLSAILNGGNTTFTYDDFGRRATMTQPNGVVTTYTYDDAGRLTEILAANSSGQIVAKSAYTLDKVGNRLSKTTKQRSTAYGYDKIYQLLEALQSTPGNSPEKGQGKKGKGVARAVQNQKEFYFYDPVGNRQQTNQVKSYTHNTGNQLLSADDTSFAYDKNGNLTSKTTDEGVTTYGWDAENRLVRVDLPDGTAVTFAYDPFGRRIEKKFADSEGERVTRYLYDNEDILYTYDAKGQIINRFIHGPGIDEPLALHQGKNSYYYHADGLGSVVALSDERGRVVQNYQYDSFGNLHDRKNRIKQPYTYTGREYDRETGLYYYRARYYDAEVGRFISEDPIGFAGGDVSLYRYALNNPTLNTDPNGKTPFYGNWCGPDWTGGYTKPWNKLTPQEQSSVAWPVNDLDSCCVTHDKCYAKCREDFSCDDDKKDACLKKCDRNLSSCAFECDVGGIMDLSIQTYFYWSQPGLFD